MTSPSRLYEILTAKPSVQELASKVVSLLGTVSFLESIVKVPIHEKDVLLFKYKWTKDFTDLTNELLKTMAPDVQSTIATMAGAKIKKAKPPAICFLVKGMVWTSKDETSILYPLPIPIDTFKDALKALSSLQISDDLKELLQFLQIPDAHKEATLRLHSRLSGKDSSKAKIFPDSIALVLENAQFEMVPNWIAFLIIPMSTFVEHGD